MKFADIHAIGVANRRAWRSAHGKATYASKGWRWECNCGVGGSDSTKKGCTVQYIAHFEETGKRTHARLIALLDAYEVAHGRPKVGVVEE